MSILKDSFAAKTLNSNGDVLSALNLATGGASLQVGKNKLVVTPETTFIANGTIKNAMIDELDAGKIRTGTLDANLVNVVNLNASNITSGKLSADLINGGVISSLNGATSFNLQTGWLEMNNHGVGIKNQFPNRPLQFLTFGQGGIADGYGSDRIPGAYIGLLSNRNGLSGRDHTAAGLQIFNGRKDSIVRSFVNLYGKKIEFRQHGGDDSPVVTLDMTKNELIGLENIIIKNNSLSGILDNIFDNFRNIWDKGGTYSRGYHPNWR